MEDKYKILKELLSEWIDAEKENLKEAKEAAGINSCGAGMAMGALEAYRNVLSDIEELEKKAQIDS